MSRTINSLHMAQTQRAAKYSLAVNARSAETDTPADLPEKYKDSVSNVYTNWIIGLFFATIFAFNLLFIYKLNLVMRVYASERSLTSEKLDNLQRMLADNSLQAKEIGSELQAMALKTKDYNEKFKELEDSNEAMSSSIENLSKAKNTLFERISGIETALEKMKNSGIVAQAQ